MQTVLEFTDNRGLTLRVDREQGVIRGVKLLGRISRNGREYTTEAIRRALPLYEGAKVNIDHPQGQASSPRSVRDRIGVIRGVKESGGLFGDFHYNPKHPLAEQIAWDAENAPENIGFSHNADIKTTARGGKTVVEEIVKVRSVDLVADPATTAGIFEGTEISERQRLYELAEAVVAKDALAAEREAQHSYVLAALAAERESQRSGTFLARIKGGTSTLDARQIAAKYKAH